MTALFLALACGPAEATLPTTTLKVDGHPLVVEVADEPAERERGLMYRKELPEDHGMLFVYPGPRRLRFWMANTPLPLDIAFVSRDGVVVDIRQMKPFDRHTTVSRKPATYAIEVERGWMAAHGVEVGDRVEGLPPPSRE